MEILDQYFKLQKEIYDYFGYVEDWVVIPLDDERGSWWFLEQGADGKGFVYHWRDREAVGTFTDSGGYKSVIYTQRFLPRWVYRGAEYTMICIDTQTDGNKFLTVFSNDRELTDPDLPERIARGWREMEEAVDRKLAAQRAAAMSRGQ